QRTAIRIKINELFVVDSFLLRTMLPSSLEAQQRRTREHLYFLFHEMRLQSPFPEQLLNSYPAITSTGRLLRSWNRSVPFSAPVSTLTPSLASFAVAAARSNPATFTQ